jgi:hypothetical protein
MKLLFITIFLCISVISYVAAISNEQKQEFDQILIPLAKFYEFIKYASTIIASLYLLFAGLSYIMASDNIEKRSSIKSTVGYILLGVALIWAAPYIVDLIIK